MALSASLRAGLELRAVSVASYAVWCESTLPVTRQTSAQSRSSGAFRF